MTAQGCDFGEGEHILIAVCLWYSIIEASLIERKLRITIES